MESPRPPADAPAREAQSKPAVSNAPSLLAGVIARLPRDTLHIEGDLLVRRRKGMVLRRLSFHMLLDLGTRPSLAQYTIMDAFGTPLERLTVVRRAGADPEFMYAAGDPLSPQPAPPPSERIQGTDLCWMDLTLSFLWWPDATLTGEDEIRGRPCIIVTVRNPYTRPGDNRATYCAAARLWIDKKLGMMVQAELLDAAGDVLRTLWVDSLKKIDGRWMIKDMEVEGAAAVHRTKLTIRDVSASSP